LRVTPCEAAAADPRGAGHSRAPGAGDENHPPQSSSPEASGPSGELARLRARLADAEATLRAIRTGEVDTVMVAGKEGSQVFSLEGAEHAYRVLMESMNEGALTLTADKMILYANHCFARMVKCPLEQVMGSFLSPLFSPPGDRATLRPLMKRADKSGSKIQVLLIACDGSKCRRKSPFVRWQRMVAKARPSACGDRHDGGPAQTRKCCGP